MRVFLDTNIIVSAFATRGLCADLFREILSVHSPITSGYILQETEDVLVRRFKVPEKTVAEIISLLRKQEVVKPPDISPQISICDLDDLPVVAAAIEAKVDCLVSGDKDRLSLVPLNEIKIATLPRVKFRLRFNAPALRLEKFGSKTLCQTLRRFFGIISRFDCVNLTGAIDDQRIHDFFRGQPATL